MSGGGATEFERRQLDRLILFSDGVFAIAITLLVLELRLPEGSEGVVDFAILAPKLVGFALSFAVIGGYWLIHRSIFGRLIKDNVPVRLLNLLFLASIVFLPFPTSVIAEFPATSSSVGLYALAVASVGLIGTLLSLAARKPGLSDPDAPTLALPLLLARSLTAPLIFAISALVAGRDPHSAILFWWASGPSVFVVNAVVKSLVGRRAPKPA